MPDERFARATAAAVVGVLLAGVLALVLEVPAERAAAPPAVAHPPDQQIVVGEVAPTPPPAAPPPLIDGPGVVAHADGVSLVAAPEPDGVGVLPPDGAPPGPPLPFRTRRTGAQELTFVLVAGSDARPGEDVARARADSIHVVALAPGQGAGTIVGIPRDSWVDIPGHGPGKVNSALAIGGPQLLAQTVAQATGLPVRYYVLAGFDGFTRLADDLGGVDVHLDRRMNDRSSGARFDRGWHHLTGAEALAFSRNRKDAEYGDFSRSGNQGIVMLATLAKMRAEIADDDGLERWVGALVRHVDLDIGLDDALDLAVAARRLDPRRVANVVASGTVGHTGGQSVVFLDDAARALFADVADDGVLRDPPPPYDPPGMQHEPPPTTTAVPRTTTTTGLLGIG